MSYFKGVMLHEYRDTCRTLTLLCITDKVGNFKKDKRYFAIGRQLGTKPTGVFAQYQFADEDGDTYTLDARDLGKHFIIVNRSENYVSS